MEKWFTLLNKFEPRSVLLPKFRSTWRWRAVIRSWASRKNAVQSHVRYQIWFYTVESESFEPRFILIVAGNPVTRFPRVPTPRRIYPALCARMISGRRSVHEVVWKKRKERKKLIFEYYSQTRRISSIFGKYWITASVHHSVRDKINLLTAVGVTRLYRPDFIRLMAKINVKY